MVAHIVLIVLFSLLHVGALLTMILVPPSSLSLWIALVLYLVRMFAITAGYHRYFAHRSFKTSRIVQFLFAFVGAAALQKGALWWRETHRDHHRYSDTDNDPHSPVSHSWFFAHVGWLFHKDVPSRHPCKDFGEFPELHILERWHWVPGVLVALACFLIDGVPGVTWGFVVSTVMLYHATFLVNSVCHIIGTRPFKTKDRSRNNVVVAFLTLGEGWHNNHHHEQNCARQGRRWWQVDVTYYLLRLMALCRLVWGIREPRRQAA